MATGSAPRIDPARFFMAAALGLFSISVLNAQDNGDENALKPPSSTEISQIETKSLKVLRNVSLGPSDHHAFRPLKLMESPLGTIRWGNLFSRDEVVALVNLAPTPSTEPYEYPPQYLSFFAWKDGQWKFRQFLGNAYNLEIHYRKGSPSAFLQGSFRTGRYGGEHLSWFYDEKSGTLKETGFEDWGPFYLAGDYLVLTRGFERLAHDDTRWIYAYKNGRKSDLLAVLHTNDSGYFDIASRNAKSGKMESWHFATDFEHEDRATITIREGVDDDGGSPESPVTGKGEVIVKGGAALMSDYCFERLTGIHPVLLGGGWAGEEYSGNPWLDQLPARPPLKRVPMEATGDPRIVAQFGSAENARKTPE